MKKYSTFFLLVGLCIWTQTAHAGEKARSPKKTEDIQKLETLTYKLYAWQKALIERKEGEDTPVVRTANEFFKAITDYGNDLNKKGLIDKPETFKEPTELFKKIISVERPRLTKKGYILIPDESPYYDIVILSVGLHSRASDIEFSEDLYGETVSFTAIGLGDYLIVGFYDWLYMLKNPDAPYIQSAPAMTHGETVYINLGAIKYVLENYLLARLGMYKQNEKDIKNGFLKTDTDITIKLAKLKDHFRFQSYEPFLEPDDDEKLKRLMSYTIQQFCLHEGTHFLDKASSTVIHSKQRSIEIGVYEERAMLAEVLHGTVLGGFANIVGHAQDVMASQDSASIRAHQTIGSQLFWDIVGDMPLSDVANLSDEQIHALTLKTYKKRAMKWDRKLLTDWEKDFIKN